MAIDDSFSMLEKKALEMKREAMMMNDITLAQKADETLQMIRHQRAQQGQWVGVTTGMAIDPASLVAKPGNIINWQRFNKMVFTPIEIEDDTYTKAKTDDAIRHVKIFVHIAKAFVERFPNWEIMPDPADPFKRIILMHKNGKYKIEDTYPSAEVKLWGAPSESVDKANNFAKRHGIPPTVFRHVAPPTTPVTTFYGWALGMDDVPDYIKE